MPLRSPSPLWTSGSRLLNEGIGLNEFNDSHQPLGQVLRMHQDKKISTQLSWRQVTCCKPGTFIHSFTDPPMYIVYFFLIIKAIHAYYLKYAYTGNSAKESKGRNDPHKSHLPRDNAVSTVVRFLPDHFPCLPICTLKHGNNVGMLTAYPFWSSRPNY